MHIRINMISTLKFGGVLRLFGKIYSLPQTKRLSKYYSIVYKLRTCHPKCVTMMNLQNISKRSISSNQLNGHDGVAVQHDVDGGRFYLEFPSLGTANIEYERIGNLIVLMHTYVPPELEGRGLGKILAKEALDYVAKNDLQLEIKCSFVRNYVSKYEPKYIKYMKK